MPRARLKSSQGGMLKTLVLAAVVIALGACAPPKAPQILDNGVEGLVTVGPSCPVMQQDVPCPDKPYAALLTILSENDRNVVGRVQAGQDGYYKVALRPGRYIVHPESPRAIPRAADAEVVVVEHQYTRLDITYDSGIR
jgi:hypothetical protein